MTPVRAKDKLFLAVAIPLAAVALYAYAYRAGATRKLESLRMESASLVDEMTFDDDMRSAKRALAAAEAELATESSAPVPPSAVKASADESPAERERQVLEVLLTCGIGVIRTEDATPKSGANDGTARGGDALKATGVRPDPSLRRYTLDGAYPAVRRALGAFASRKMAVVPESLEMRENGRGRWTLSIWQ